ncbi:MAG: cytidylate kinase [Hydrogenophilales bacterium CG17_big_fil_post_rev_8_21_14_2_50_63_12]|nr:MAG: cytidylate kinase [Hydrogenophilales bacterium CG17_big_fil_post_rev_8_21_14_2_50_63_12]PIX98002.1 MAG: cytidylate kinase [Hydrogenophilales bacterium CG_4_10_14_3_um_filter_63_21]PJB02598.1 MAG: cytidylate kinase [Hydrogenophilales bacterium CG_4_9_14_3_um_filter_63_34]
MTQQTIPVIAIDGPSASGKGTVAALVARELGFHYLDSGAIYRVTAYAAQQGGVALEDEPGLVELAHKIALRFDGVEVYLNGAAIGNVIRSEEAGRAASQIAALPALRAALLERQRAFRQAPGLVTDGRDMGSVVFPDATVKIFLTASAEERAQRRYKQLIEKDFDASLAALLQDLRERDARDAARSSAPLRQSADAALLDTTNLTIAQAVARVLQWFREAKA